MSQPSAQSKCDYAITLAIPSFKKVNYLGKYKAYNLFPKEEQKMFITGLFQTSVEFILDEECKSEIYIEEHADKRLHLHTYLKNVSYDTIYNIQEHLCRVLGIRPKQYQQVFNFFKPDSFHYWMLYCQKEVNDLDKDLAELN